LGAAERVPEPRYRRVALLDKGVEIREYPALAIAKTPMRDASLGTSSSEGFRRVARYLFGGNRSKESMAMTAPVVMEMGDTPALYFYMPFDRSLEALPATMDQRSFGNASIPHPGCFGLWGLCGEQRIAQTAQTFRSRSKKGGLDHPRPLSVHGLQCPLDLGGATQRGRL